MRTHPFTRTGALFALLVSVSGSGNAEGGGLASLVAVGAQNLYITPASVATNFAAETAPCSFESATPLTTQLNATGMTFSGAGSVLNQCSEAIAAPGSSDNNFLAYQGSDSPVTEHIYFSGTQQTFLFSIIGSQTVAVAAMMGESIVASGMFGIEGPAAWQSVVLYNAEFNSVMITAGGDTENWALDDFYATAATTVPEPATLVLFAFGAALLLLVRLARRVELRELLVRQTNAGRRHVFFEMRNL